MARRKKAWNSSNPLYRYLHGGARKSKGVKTMARRKRGGFRRSRRSGLGGGNIIMKGLFGNKLGMGIVGTMLVGAGVAYAAKRFAPQVVTSVPMGEHAIAGVAAGIPGIIGNVIASSFLNGSSGVSNSSSAYGW